MLYVGIDQHRKQLTVSIRDESGDVVLRRQVSTQWDKVRAFFKVPHDWTQFDRDAVLRYEHATDPSASKEGARLLRPRIGVRLKARG